MEALIGAIKTDPDCGRLWTLLGHHHGTIYNLDIPGFETPLQKAVEYAERGALLEPHCQRAIGTLALIRFYSNELTIAIDEVNRALSLNPNSLFVLDGLAYILILSGDWNRGVKIAEKVIKMNPYHRVVLHDALWVNYLRQGKYNHAYHEAMHGRRQWLFWDPLEKASTLGLLGQHKEGQEYAEKLLKLRPDFPIKGRKLIRNYIKFEEISERVELGLKQVEIKLS
jgi:tetratricopeptide (TPR) repeat protein